MMIATAIAGRVVSKSMNTSTIALAIRGIVTLMAIFLVAVPQRLLLSGVRARDEFFQRPLTLLDGGRLVAKA